MVTFGENLRRLRKERKMSMDALAEKACTSKQVLSRYENGSRVPKISMVKKLADALGVSISELSGEESHNTVTFSLNKPTARLIEDDKPTMADAILDNILYNDDELWQIREDMRRKPELRTLWDMQRNATKQELKQMEAFIRAIRSSNDYEGDDTP